MMNRTMLALALLLSPSVWADAQPVTPAPPAPPVVDAPGSPPKKGDALNLVISGHLLNEDANDPVRGVPAKVHAVKMLKGQTYVIDMVSTDFDSYLRLVDSANRRIAEDDDGGGNLNSRIRYVAEKDDTYLIYASHLAGGEGAYTLSVKSSAPDPLKLIPMATPAANAPSEFKGQLVATDPSCSFRDHPAKFHSMELKKGKKYVIDLMSEQFDSHLILADSRGVTLASHDHGGDKRSSRLRYTPTVDATFRIVATTLNNQLGAYTVRVTEE